MPLDQRLHGKDGRVQMDAGGVGSPLVTLGDMNGWTLSMSTAREVVTAFEDTNVRRVAGLPDFAGTLSMWWNAVASSSPAYFAAVLAGDPVWLRLFPNKDDSTVFFEGLANVDGGVNVSATGAVGGTGSWDAAGNWTLAP